MDALGHNYVQSGNVYTCSRCGDSYTGHEHSYTESTTEPTCLTAGYTVYTCSCGDSYTVEIPALGHNYVLVNQTGNVATYECSRCGHRYTAVIPIDPNPPVEYGLRNGNVTVTTERHDYVYASGKLLREVITTTDAEGNVTTETLDFTYDASGSPYTLTYTNGTASPVTYYYVVNLQGDVIRLVSANGATAAEYAYDPWGRVNSATGTMAEANPLRYRGYYYDAEMEFYYLQSRYYDPAICRFINADGYASTGQGFLGQNMFAYCNNSPITQSDPTGCAAGGLPVMIVNVIDGRLPDIVAMTDGKEDSIALLQQLVGNNELPEHDGTIFVSVRKTGTHSEPEPNYELSLTLGGAGIVLGAIGLLSLPPVWATLVGLGGLGISVYGYADTKFSKENPLVPKDYDTYYVSLLWQTKSYWDEGRSGGYVLTTHTAEFCYVFIDHRTNTEPIPNDDYFVQIGGTHNSSDLIVP